MKILNLMAKALRMEPNDMIELFEEGMQAMRMNYYPPCPQPELVIGLNPHSDATGLTIVLQLNEMEGLQIRKDGMWVPVKPLPDAFIVNIGDILEIVTNGIYHSIEHRAIVNSSKERLFIATFYNPKLEGDMDPAPSLITPETPALFRRIGFTEYFKGFFFARTAGKIISDKFEEKLIRKEQCLIQISKDPVAVDFSWLESVLGLIPMDIQADLNSYPDMENFDLFSRKGGGLFPYSASDHVMKEDKKESDDGAMVDN
ncbi:hypothetical protein Ddye_024457 [Dipteronia dyeriana]|uniref:Fe2OG dioxygenase domain-containing protein n=1 Tax=Dipteronia dyeriana TaxID=168575 RepID=A0AAD9TVU0_9ROSI|nr:hypothetical protein Ddye_024457 [Dipteronia dyeriana]